MPLCLNGCALLFGSFFQCPPLVSLAFLLPYPVTEVMAERAGTLQSASSPRLQRPSWSASSSHPACGDRPCDTAAMFWNRMERLLKELIALFMILSYIYRITDILKGLLNFFEHVTTFYEGRYILRGFLKVSVCMPGKCQQLTIFNLP